MAYTEKYRGSPPAVILRKYRCTDCGGAFEQRVASRDAPAPECPTCAAATQAIPSMPAVRASPEARAAVDAVDLTWDIAQKDFGMTNMNDHVRPGDVVAKGPPPMQTSERQAVQQEVAELLGPAAAEHLSPDQQLKVKDFWQGGMGAPAVGSEQMGAARAASQDAVNAKVDALSVLEAGKQSGTMRPRYDVLNSAETRKLEV